VSSLIIRDDIPLWINRVNLRYGEDDVYSHARHPICLELIVLCPQPSQPIREALLSRDLVSTGESAGGSSFYSIALETPVRVQRPFNSADSIADGVPAGGSPLHEGHPSRRL
jgi:hypothetical protein